MAAIRRVAHLSIPVSDTAKSTKFYKEVVGCRHLSTTPKGQMVFIDAAGTCLILVKRDTTINPVPDNHGGVHHAFAIAHDDYGAALDILRSDELRRDRLARAFLRQTSRWLTLTYHAALLRSRFG